MKGFLFSLDTAQKIALGFYFLSLTGFYSVLLLRTLNLVDEEFSVSAFQFLLAAGGYAVFGKTANVFAESRRDRYRNEERGERD